MVKTVAGLPLLALAFFLSACTISDAPLYPGAQRLDPRGVASPSPSGQVTSKTRTALYQLPPDATFKDVHEFFSDDLETRGYNENGRMAMQIDGGTAESVSYTSHDGDRTITVALINNPNLPDEKLISVSETSVSAG